MGKKKN